MCGVIDSQATRRQTVPSVDLLALSTGCLLIGWHTVRLDRVMRALETENPPACASSKVLGPARGWPKSALTVAEIDHKEDKSKTQADAGCTQSDGAHCLSPRRLRIKAGLLSGLKLCGSFRRLFLLLALPADLFVAIRESVRCGILLGRCGILSSTRGLRRRRVDLLSSNSPLSCCISDQIEQRLDPLFRPSSTRETRKPRELHSLFLSDKQRPVPPCRISR